MDMQVAPANALHAVFVYHNPPHVSHNLLLPVRATLVTFLHIALSMPLQS